MNNSEQEFISWGIKSGIPAAILHSLIEVAATPEQMRRAIEEMLPGPPIFPIENIRELHENDLMGIHPAKAGFLVVGNCPNGDPIAINIGREPGSVWYLSHEQMFGKDLRLVAAKVAADIPSFREAMANNKSFPLDSWEAR